MHRSVIVLVALAACTSTHPAGTTLAGEARAEVDGKAIKARVLVEFHPDSCGFWSVKCADGDATMHRLQIERDGQALVDALLILAVPNWYGDGPPDREYKKLYGAKYEVAISPDGHALGLRYEGRWRYVGLDTPVPLFCAHHTYDQPPFGVRTRDVALEILRSRAGTGGADHMTKVFERPGSEAGREVARAEAYAVAHVDDLEVATALALERIAPCPEHDLSCAPTSYDGAPSDDALAAAAGSAIARVPELRAAYAQALASTTPNDGEQKWHAADALGYVADASNRAALFAQARTVAAFQKSADYENDQYTCLLRERVVRSIARVVGKTHRASDAQVAQLVAWAQSPTACCPGADPEPGCQIFAMYALAASGSPRTRPVIEPLAKAACTSTATIPKPPELADTEWLGPETVPCAAQIALAYVRDTLLRR
jgi:hypothetical protein